MVESRAAPEMEDSCGNLEGRKYGRASRKRRIVPARFRPAGQMYPTNRLDWRSIGWRFRHTYAER
jgi:hypothetical protein